MGATGPVTVRPLSNVTVNFSGGAISGASGGADTISVLAAGATLQGAIPAGWTFETNRVVTVTPAPPMPGPSHWPAAAGSPARKPSRTPAPWL